MIDLGVLRAEIDATPSLAALVDAGQDATIAEALNGEGNNEELVYTPITFTDLVGFLEPSEAPAPGSAERSWLDLLAQSRAIQMSAEMLDRFASVFGQGRTVERLVSGLASRPARRGEELFGRDTMITADDVSACYADEREAVYRAAQAPLDALKADLDVAIGEYIKAPGKTRRDAVTAAEAAIKAEHERGGVVFADNEAPSVLVLGAE